MNKKNQILKENLFSLMKRKKVSPAKLCRDLSLNKSTFHNYLNGVTPQGVESLVRLSMYFNLSLDELLFQDSKKIIHRYQIDEDYYLTITYFERKK